MGKTKEIFLGHLNRLLTRGKVTSVANFIGVSVTTVSRWKDGVTFPELENLEKLAEYFGMEVYEFFVDKPVEPRRSEADLQAIEGLIKYVQSLPEHLKK